MTERGDDRRPPHEGEDLDEHSEIEPTSDAAKDLQPSNEDRGDRDTSFQGPPPDANDELGQYEGTYERTGDLRDEYGTGGGDVGIGGDVSPHGAMHDAAAVDLDIAEDEALVSGSELSRQGVGERDEDLDLVSDDIAMQGVDEAWPRAEELSEDDPRAGFDDADAPFTDVRNEDELDAA